MVQNLILDDYIVGDTFGKVKFELLLDDPIKPIIIKDASLKVRFTFNNRYGKLVKILTVGNGITITDYINGKFEIDEINNFLSSHGNYYYNIEITYPTGQVITVLEGAIIAKNKVFN